MTALRVGVVNRFTNSTRHEYPLGRALERLGAGYVPLDVRDIRADLPVTGAPVVSIGGSGPEGLDDLDGLVWRVSENDFHRFADVQRLLAARLPMINSWECGQVCANKWTTSVVLAEAGVRVVPSTLLLPGGPVPAFPGSQTVIKPVIGARGRGVRLVSADLDPLINEPHVAQPRVSGAVHDQFRVLVCAPATVLAAHRRPASVGRHTVEINNVEAGGAPLPARAEPVRDIALAAMDSLGGVLLGVDIVRWAGDWAVLEVNASPGLKGIAAVVAEDCYRLAAQAVLTGVRSVA